MTVTTGDCLTVMAAMEPASVDAVVCDPPYGLEFMGKEWDSFKTGRGAKYAAGGAINDVKFKDFGKLPSYVNRPAKRCALCGKQSWSGSPCTCPTPEWVIDNSPLHAFQRFNEAWAREAYRVAKPGAHLVAFGGTRTHHRLMVAIEDAGWEIRDCLMWLYGSGFPKSHNGPWGGTALKPAWEPIILARKPLAGTVAATVAAHGTGGLNVDGCRIGTETVRSSGNTGMDARRFAHGTRPTDYASRQEPSEHAGRWPANVVLGCDCPTIRDKAQELARMVGSINGNPEEGWALWQDWLDSWVRESHQPWCPVGRLDRQTGERTSGSRQAGTYGMMGFGGNGDKPMPAIAGDAGGPSRFFYTAKASRSEREAGLDHQTKAIHPTVKPIALMRWLCRLVTPPGGLILDPFTGSGSTGCAAVLEGFRFHGIELSEDYAAIARQRIAHYRTMTTAQLALEFDTEAA